MSIFTLVLHKNLKRSENLIRIIWSTYFNRLYSWYLLSLLS